MNGKCKYCEKKLSGNQTVCSNCVTKLKLVRKIVKAFEPYRKTEQTETKFKTTEQLYLNFRSELDKMCVKDILSRECETIPIFSGGKTVGIFCTRGDYIDCVYVLPKYRKQGLAKKAVIGFYERNGSLPLRLHIINNNYVALKFWNSIFELREIESNAIDTLYITKYLKQ